MKTIKTCPICTQPFRAYHVTRVTCSRRCCRVHLKALMHGRTPVKAVLAHAAKRRQQIEALATERFGTLTVREIALFNFAAKAGYRRGYQFGKHREEAA